MRIIHVVTLVSPDGAFGGPVRVAANHVRELRLRGHDAVLAAATQGYRVLPSEIDGVPAALFPARRIAPLGFSGLVAPGLLRWMRSEADSVDVVHIHLARDLVTVPVGLLAIRRGLKYVVQPHGMIDRSDRMLAGILDRAAVRKILVNANAVFFLTPRERSEILGLVGDPGNLRHLPNGVPNSAPSAEPPHTEVLYLGRLHSRKRVALLAEVAQELINDGLNAQFSIVGPDEGELPAIRKKISSPLVKYEGAVAPGDAGDRINQCSLFVLPSVDEPFPMAALEAMARGKPVIVTESCGIAPDISSANAGWVVNHTRESLKQAIQEALLDPGERFRRGKAARDLATTRFSQATVIDMWEQSCLASQFRHH